MKKLTSSFPAIIIVCCLTLSLYAQNDSTRLDAGSQVLQRKFTQGITIKGADLEKMPFASLTDAISAWSYGVYTRSTDMIYVVDGNLVTDVNVYSIYDIEEIVLVQNASVLTNTAGTQGQLLLITTRRGKGKPGFRVAGGTNVVSMPGRTTGLYHQYYAGVDRKLGDIDLGISADWLHDLLPMTRGNNIKTTTPYNMDRWRFNAYFVLHAGKQHTIEFHANYSPQTLDSAMSFGPAGQQTSYLLSNRQSQNIFTPWARWHGTWLPGLTNDLQAGYLAELNKGDYDYTVFGYPSGGGGTTTFHANGHNHTDHIFIRDHLSYRMDAGAWSLEPSLDASYEHIKSSAFVTSFSVSNNGSQIYDFTRTQSGAIYILTPAVDLSYKHALDIRGGVVANVSPDHYTGVAPKRIYPFASLSFDVLRMADAVSGQGLTIFGSYAKRSFWGARDYTVNDLANANNPYQFPTGLYTLDYYGNAVINNSLVAKAPGYWVWQAGAGYSALGKRLQIDYHFERRNYATLEYNYITGNVLSDISVLWTSSLHYAAISGKILDGNALSWRSGLTAAVLRSRTDSNFIVYDLQPAGDHYPGDQGTSWTGGWVNRVEYKSFGAGIDLIYHFNEAIPDAVVGSNLTFHRQNTLVLQHIYASYKIPMRGAGTLELYVDGRGLLQGSGSTLADQRRYYGVGGKLAI